MSICETDSVDHKHATDSHQELNEEKLYVKNVNPKTSSYSKLFGSSSTFKTVGIKTEDIDILYEDIKRETEEEKSSESIGFCVMCHESFVKETDFVESTECTCQNQNESLFYDIRDEDTILDVKPYLITDLELQSLRVQDGTISVDEITKKQDSSAASHRLPMPSLENDNKIKCEFCTQKKNLCQSCLESFSEMCHTGEKLFPCKICSKSFSKMYLKVHERVHTGEKPFCCNICSKAFTTSSNLKAHERIHTKKLFHCKVCSKSFIRKDHLKVHKRIHTGEKPYNCKICFKAFTYSSDLRSHEKIHAVKGSFHCKLCSKSFTLISSLKSHERDHTGEKIFHCAICSKTFTSFYLLKVHLIIHAEEKFKCKICSTSFSKKSSLKLHESRHVIQFNDSIIHAEKKFNCRICSKSLSTQKSLRAHERRHIVQLNSI